MECLRKSRIPLLLAYGYLFLPFLLFAGGWLKWYVAAPVIAALLYVFYRMARGAPALWSPVWNRRAVWKLLAILCVIAVWVFFSGIGKFTFQNEDHNTRNVMFDMLVEGDWPLVYENPPAEYYGEPVAFTYYLGFWLPAALVGKAFGLAAGRVAQVVWAALGIAIFYSLVLANFVKKLIVWPLFLFIFFSGMDIVGMLFLGRDWQSVGLTEHIDWWAGTFQYSSFTTQLFWVFNQAVPAWVALLAILSQRSSRQIVPLLALSMITSTLPFIGLIPFAVYIALRNYGRRFGFRPFSLRTFLRETFTVENLLGGGLIGILSFLYLSNNFAGSRLGFNSFNSFGGILALWIVFQLCEAVPFLVLLYRKQRHKAVYYITAASLLSIPLFKVGGNVDFCMRVSIPALVMLYLLVLDALRRTRFSRQRGWCAALAAVLILGSVTPAKEILRATSETIRREREGVQVYIDDLDPMAAPWRDNFFGGTNSFFFRYLAR